MPQPLLVNADVRRLPFPTGAFDVVMAPHMLYHVDDDASIATDYVASVADHYQHQVDRPWPEIVADVGAAVEDVIRKEGVFIVTSAVGAFVCR